MAAQVNEIRWIRKWIQQCSECKIGEPKPGNLSEKVCSIDKCSPDAKCNELGNQKYDCKVLFYYF